MCYEDGYVAMEKWLWEEEFSILSQGKKAINSYHKIEGQGTQEVALFCSEAPCKCKQQPWLLLVTGCLSDSDRVSEWKQSSSDVNVPMGYEHHY